MGFSGGGTNILKAHTHNGLTALDGGALDFNNITQSQSSAGQVFYSDGVHLQQLAYPGVPAGETLTAAALSSAPSWAAGGGGGGGGWEFVEQFTNPSTQTTFTCTLASPISLADYIVRVQFVLKTDSITSAMDMELNGGGRYFLNGNPVSDGAVILSNGQLAADTWTIGGFQYYGNSLDTDRTMGFMNSTTGNQAGGETFGLVADTKTFVYEGATTEINEVEFLPSSGNVYINSYVRVYRMAVS